MKYQAIGKNILIKLDPKPEKVGSIIVASSSDAVSMTGVAVSVGQEVSEVKDGDRVRILRDYDLAPVDKDDQLCICLEENIGCIILD
jgi:co-chaperonin GroES (HSP10)